MMRNLFIWAVLALSIICSDSSFASNSTLTANSVFGPSSPQLFTTSTNSFTYTITGSGSGSDYLFINNGIFSATVTGSSIDGACTSGTSCIDVSYTSSKVTISVNDFSKLNPSFYITVSATNNSDNATVKLYYDKQTADEPPVINSASLGSYVMSTSTASSFPVPIAESAEASGVYPGTGDSGDPATITSFSPNPVTFVDETDSAFTAECSSTFALALVGNQLQVDVDPMTGEAISDCDGHTIAISALSVTNSTPDTSETVSDAFPVTLASQRIAPTIHNNDTSPFVSIIGDGDSFSVPIEAGGAIPSVDPGTDDSGDAATITSFAPSPVTFVDETESGSACASSFSLDDSGLPDHVTVTVDAAVPSTCDGHTIAIDTLSVTNSTPETSASVSDAFPVTLFNSIVMTGGDIANNDNDSSIDPVVQCADATGSYSSTFSHLFTTDQLAPTTDASWVSGSLGSIQLGADDVKADFGLNLDTDDNAFTLNQTLGSIPCQYAGYQAAVVMTVNDDHPNTETNTTTPYTFYVTDSPEMSDKTDPDQVDVDTDFNWDLDVSPGHDDNQMIFDTGSSLVENWSDGAGNDDCTAALNNSEAPPVSLTVTSSSASLGGQIPTACVNKTLTADVTLKNKSSEGDFPSSYGETATAEYTINVSNTQEVEITCPLYASGKWNDQVGADSIAQDDSFSIVYPDEYTSPEVSVDYNASIYLAGSNEFSLSAVFSEPGGATGLTCFYTNSVGQTSAQFGSTRFSSSSGSVSVSRNGADAAWPGNVCDPTTSDDCSLTATVTLDQ
jgi:hypothetical protein